MGGWGESEVRDATGANECGIGNCAWIHLRSRVCGREDEGACPTGHGIADYDELELGEYEGWIEGARLSNSCSGRRCWSPWCVWLRCGWEVYRGE